MESRKSINSFHFIVVTVVILNFLILFSSMRESASSPPEYQCENLQFMLPSIPNITNSHYHHGPGVRLVSEKFYFPLPKFENPSSNLICIMDVDFHHIDMFLNAAVTLEPFCSNFLALALHAEVTSFLDLHKIPYTFSQEVVDAEISRVRSGHHSQYLAVPMMAKGRLIFELLLHGFDVFVSDTDVFHFRSMPAIVSLNEGGNNRLIDIVVSTYVSSNQDENEWQGNFVNSMPVSVIPNTGVIVYRSSPRVINFFKDILFGPKGVGWIQTNFVLLMKRQKSFRHSFKASSSNPNIFVGSNSHYNVTIALMASISSKMDETCRGDPIYEANSSSCFHHHAVGASSTDDTTVKSNQIFHSKYRKLFMKHRGFWILRKSWRNVQPCATFREYLSLVDLRRQGSQSEILEWLKFKASPNLKVNFYQSQK